MTAYWGTGIKVGLCPFRAGSHEVLSNQKCLCCSKRHESGAVTLSRYIFIIMHSAVDMKSDRNGFVKDETEI